MNSLAWETFNMHYILRWILGLSNKRVKKLITILKIMPLKFNVGAMIA